MVCIYVLKDPTNNEIKYVGKTKRTLCERLCRHKAYARETSKPTYTTNWINSLLKENLSPMIECIEKCTELNWQDREKFWIRYYKNKGIKLTNYLEGGQGAYGGINTASFKGRKHSEKSKLLIGLKNKQIKKSESWIKNAADAQCMSVYGIHINTNEKIEFSCIRDAALFIGDIKFRKNIHQCLKNSRPTAYKYKWFYNKITEVKDKEL